MSEQGTYAKILRVDSIGVRVETRIANGSLAINAITVAYDALGRQVEDHDAAGVTTYGYDAYGANTDETVIGVAGTNTIERFTDAYGRSAGYALNGSRQTILGYDEQTGRLATMATGEGRASSRPQEAFSWNYVDGTDLKSQLAYPNGLTATWTYDANSQLLQVCNATPTNVISQYDYTYDAAGRRIACARSGVAMSVADTIAYAYNARGELTNAVSNIDANYAYAYQYDDIGNRITSEECGVRSAGYVANELNQYTQIVTASSAFSASPCETFNPEFDDDGNQTLIRTATGTWRVTYNGENRSVFWTCLAACDTVAISGETIAMSYDRLGRRAVKNDQHFIYDGYLQIANIQSPTPTIHSNYFVWDPAEPVATRPLAWNIYEPDTWCQAQGTLFYTHGSNKNVGDVVAVNGDIVAHYECAPFGAVMVQYGVFSAANPWRFSSEYADDDTVTSYYNYRHVESVTERWLQRDPITLYSCYLDVLRNRQSMKCLVPVRPASVFPLFCLAP